MRFLFLYFFTLSVLNNVLSQTNYNSCGNFPDWENIIQVSTPVPDSLPKFLVITNRPFSPDNEDKIYLPNGIAQYRKVTYLEVACNGTKWLIHPREDFNDAMKIMDEGKDILLFVHGHGKSFPLSLPRALQVKNRYDVSLILFDWPAKHSNFNKSLARVRRCGENFYNLLLDLQEYHANSMSDNQHLSILAHSLGNYYLTHFVVNGSWQYLNAAFVDNIIFNAPAVRSKEHGEIISRITISNNKYVVLNKNDRVLKSAYLLTSGKMLGNIVIKPYAENTIYVNFTEIAGKEHTYFVGYHPFENENKTVFELYNTLIHGGKPDFNTSDFEVLNEKEYFIK